VRSLESSADFSTCIYLPYDNTKNCECMEYQTRQIYYFTAIVYYIVLS